MLKFVVQFLILLWLWNNNRKAKKGWFVPSSILLGIYTICSAFAIGDLYIDDYTQPFDSRYWGPMFFFLLTLIFFLLPARIFNETKTHSLVLPSKEFLDVFSTVLIVLSFFSIIFFSSTVSMIFRGDLGELRNDLYAGNEYVEAGLANTIASVSSSLYVVAILLFFIYSALGGSKIRCFLLLVSSISEPMHVLAYVGRDGIVFWLFSFLFLYAFFKPFLSDKTNKTILKTFVMSSAALLIPFILISISRFAGKDIGTQGSFISYLGQSFINGPLFFGIENPPYNRGASFKLFCDLIGITPYDLGMIEIGDWMSWHFSTFVVSLCINFGLLGTYLVGVMMLIVFSVIFGVKQNKMHMSQMFIYILYFHIIGEGVFYFRQYTRGGNLFIILCIVLYLYFSFLKTTQNSIVLKRVHVEKHKLCRKARHSFFKKPSKNYFLPNNK